MSAGPVVADATDEALERIAEAVAAEVRALLAVLPAALEVQWQPAPIPHPEEDTAERGKGGHSDPTPAVALDERRLAVRVAVLGSLRRVREARDALAESRQDVERSLARWHGESGRDAQGPETPA